MPQAIVYCDRCGKIVPPGEIGRGQAIVGEEDGICPSCVANISPGQRDELRLKLTGVALHAVGGRPPRASASRTGTSAAGCGRPTWR